MMPLADAMAEQTRITMKKRITARERREARAESDRQLARFREWMAERQRKAPERALSRPAGLVDAEYEVAMLLRATYGISEKATNWLLRESPYRPPEAGGCDVPLPGHPTRTLRVVLSWREQDIHVAARRFVSECQQATPTLWMHPCVKGRFKLRPASNERIERAFEVVA